MADTSALVESLLSAKLHLSPQVVGDRLYFVSNQSGHMSLFSLDLTGGDPVQLIPADLALPNPKLLGPGQPFSVHPDLGTILLTIDHHGDENYQPHFVPIGGGEPEPVWGDRFAGLQVLTASEPADGKAILAISPRTDPNYQTYVADLSSRELTDLGSSVYGNFPIGHSDDYRRFAVIDAYSAGDSVLYVWEADTGQRRLLAGTPLEERTGEVAPTGFGAGHVRDDSVLVTTSLFTDTYGLGLVPITGGDPIEVPIRGTRHEGVGELTGIQHLDGDRYHLAYNIDGCSWGYEGSFDGDAVTVDRVLWGTGALADGVVQSASRETATGRWAVAFSTATTPVQLYTLDDTGAHRHTTEEVVGVDTARLAPGEDASFISHDGTRVSARLYVPADAPGPLPVVYYVHGGPQSQERPDFTWFSMPLIQLFVLHGFAVFVPNARGSTGYGMAYTKQVDNDWGGADRLDHVAAVEMLSKDDRLDTDRIGVMGRSYGGYMTLTLLGRHPDIWAAGIEMFGPYDLFTFLDALPETWKTFFYLSIGHPDRDREFLTDRSPRTHLDALAAPLLVIQGRNDPRVVVGESDRLVEELRSNGKQIDYLVFDDEGHDMVKHANKARAYGAIVDFFIEHLMQESSRPIR
ncbi:MAG: S9 family peptidase [Acidimicrobiia bacterium]|nr:S9 family peptidase [Acidimicrobiia bacterium]